MSPGEFALLLGTVPYGILVGLSLSNPLSGVVFYLTYSYLGIKHLREGRKGLRVYTIDALVAILFSLLANLTLIF